jgi:hypothetical protein
MTSIYQMWFYTLPQEAERALEVRIVASGQQN